MESIMYRNPELEASFSFNSAVQIFSDDDDDDEEFIEIGLEQLHSGDESPEELELRVSFSSSYNNNIAPSRTSTVESLGSDWETATTTTTTPTSSSLSLSTSTLSCSYADKCWATHKTVNRRMQIPAVHRLLSGFLSTPMTSSEHVSRDGTFDESRQVEIQTKMNQLDLLRRKADAKMTKGANGGMMMKLLIKCRSINIRAVLASFMKPYQIIISSSPQSNQKKKRSKETTSQSLLVKLKPFDKWLVQSEKPNHDYCPSSNNYSLPIQQGYTGDCRSIQAAIAHCKRSFGQTSEFHF